MKNLIITLSILIIYSCSTNQSKSNESIEDIETPKYTYEHIYNEDSVLIAVKTFNKEGKHVRIKRTFDITTPSRAGLIEDPFADAEKNGLTKLSSTLTTYNQLGHMNTDTANKIISNHYNKPLKESRAFKDSLDRIDSLIFELHTTDNKRN